MNDVENLFFGSIAHSIFSEAVADDQFDFIDNLVNEEDDTSAESEEI